jgi:hypothetical protein
VWFNHSLEPCSPKQCKHMDWESWRVKEGPIHPSNLKSQFVGGVEEVLGWVSSQSSNLLLFSYLPVGRHETRGLVLLEEFGRMRPIKTVQ